VTRKVVVFTLGAEEYAFPIERVREVIRYTRPRSVASKAAWVRGVINLRGQIVAVYDLAARLETTPPNDATAKIVILDPGTGVAGVVVDQVKEVRTLQEQDLGRVPGADTTIIESMATVGERMILLLKPEALFAQSV
jgi:purine-binding chemotaxis protein CheW